MRSKALTILIVLTVAIAVAAVMARKDKGEVVGTGEALFPALLNNINDITTVVGIGGGETFTLVRQGDRWVVSEKHGYPADPEKARQLILGTARLQRIEAKTSNPDLYTKIGLDDINAKGGNAVQYSFKNAAGNTLAEIIIGNSRLGRSDPQLSEYFIREPAMAQTWLVQGKLPEANGAIEWLDSRLLNIDRERVRQVTVRHPDGAVVTVSKKKPSQRGFDLHDVPEGVELESEFMLSDLGRSLATLDIADVMPVSDANVPDDGLDVEMTTFDGLRVSLRSVKDGDRTLARIQASFDGSLQSPEFLPGGAQAEGESTNLLGTEAVREEAVRLNGNWQGWIYVLPDYRAKYMSVRKEDIFKKKGAS
ncbi:MAG: DUF4340 domain-containing protein [Lysobacterales bacterium]|nr:MAG: DUF4340 domain-containing protein [Xanthomonadales bacterium]